MPGKIIVANGKTLLCKWENTKVEVWNSTAAAEKTTITCTAASTLSGGEFFTLSTPSNDYYVWFSKAGTGSEPDVDGIGVQVSLNSEDAAGVALAVRTELGKKADVIVTVDDDDVIIESAEKGDATDAADGSVATGFGFTQDTDGSGDLFNGVPFNDVVEIVDMDIADDGSANFFCLEKQVLTEEILLQDATPSKRTKTNYNPVLKTKTSGWVTI